jgi:hypothetical protein
MAYSCNGSNQYFSTSAVPLTSPPFTFCCWFKTTQMSQSPFLVNLINSADTTKYFCLVFRGAAAGDPVQLLSGPPANTVTSTTGCTSGVWHHACGVHTSLSSRTIYLDGGSSATNTATLTTSGIDSLYIASFEPGSSSDLDGQIAEVGIWSVALTAAEIASLAKGMTCDKVRPQSLVFYAPLVRDLIDAKGGLTITNNNGATVAAHPRVYA